MSIEKLRFKDENGNYYPDWKSVSLGDIFSITTGTTKRNEKAGKFIIVDMGSVSSSGRILSHKRTKSNKDILEAGTLVMPKDDIGGGNIICKVVYIDVDNKYVLGDHVFKLISKKMNTLFLSYRINSASVNHSMRRKVTGSAQLGINQKSVTEEVIRVPRVIIEQEKIGNFLSLFDRLIEKLEIKIGLLKELKKGYLQQMFPTKGEKVPKIRFAGFDEEWENIRISNLLNYKRPDPFIVSNDNYSNEFNTPVLTANKGFLLGYTNETQTFNDECIIFDDFTLDNKFVNFPFMVKSSAIKILVNRDGYNLYFIYNLFKTVRFDVIGHARHYISIVQQTKVKSPNIEEQEKIGNFFKNLDSMIEKHEKELDAIEQLKKGYMQRLFA